MISVKNTQIPLRTAAAKIRLPAGTADIAEIRLRAGRCAAAVTASGKIIRCSAPFSEKDIAECFAELCRYSVHSYSSEIAEGFITLDGGHRVGICGSAVISGGRITSVKDISSLNIRIAREVRGCAEEIYGRFFGDGLRSLILAGAPMSGKTTILRDLSRILGQNHRVAVIDSRNELSASVHGLPSLDVGENTDVLCGYPKAEGIMTALRSLSPEIIICDEIGNDCGAVEMCLFCGVKLVAAAHAGSLSELSRRQGTDRLLPMFDCAAVIGEKGRLIESRVIR